MLTDLTTSVANISSEELDKLFEGTPEGTPSAETVGKTVDTKPIGGDSYDKIDIDKIEKDAEVKDEKVEDKKDEKVEDKKDEKIDDKTPVAGDAKDAVKTDATADATKTVDAEKLKADAAILKNTVDYLVQKGIFKDFEGRENLEMTEEIYGQLLEAQFNKIVEDRYEAKKSSAGEEGKAILEYLEKGGDPDVIVELFKERREIAQFDISTEDSQKELISKYYREVLGWKPERIQRQLNFLATQEDALKDESGDIKRKYDEHFANQKELVERQQAAYVAEQSQRQKAFETSIKTAIKDYSQDDKIRQNLENSLFRIRTLADGTKVNDFYLKFAEWQADPKKYIELAEFITDHENYLKRKKNEGANEAIDKSFKFLKGSQTISKNKGSEHTDIEDKNYSGTNFNVIFK